MKRYNNPEMNISMFELESVATIVSGLAEANKVIDNTLGAGSSQSAITIDITEL